MLESKKYLIHDIVVQHQEGGSNTTSLPKTPGNQMLIPRLTVINDFLQETGQPTTAAKDVTVKRKKNKERNKLVQSLQGKQLEKLTSKQFNNFQNQFEVQSKEGEINQGLNGLALEATKRNNFPPPSSFSHSQTISTIISPKQRNEIFDKAKEVECPNINSGFGNQQSQQSNIPMISLERSKIHQDNSINAINIRKQNIKNKQQNLLSPILKKRQATSEMGQIQKESLSAPQTSDDKAKRKKQFSQFNSNIESSNDQNQNKEVKQMDYIQSPFGNTQQYGTEMLNSLKNYKNIWTRQERQFAHSKTQYKQIDKLKSIRNQNILEYKRNLSQMQHIKKNYKEQFRDDQNMQTPEYMNKNQSEMSHLARSNAAFTQEGQQNMMNRIAVESVDVDPADNFQSFQKEQTMTDNQCSVNYEISTGRMTESEFYLPQSKKFLVGSKYIEVPHQNLYSLEQKYKRVDSLVTNLNKLKTQVACHFINQKEQQIIQKQSKAVTETEYISIRKGSQKSMRTQSIEEKSIEVPITELKSSNKRIIESRQDPFLFHKLDQNQIDVADQKMKSSVDKDNEGLAEEDNEKVNLMLIEEDNEEERKMIKRVINDLDRMMKARIQQQEASKKSQLAFVKLAQPDISFVTKKINQAKKELESSIDSGMKDRINIQNKLWKYSIKEAYKKHDVIIQVMDKDREFKSQCKVASHTTMHFLNDVFKNIQQGKEIVLDLDRSDQKQQKNINEFKKNENKEYKKRQSLRYTVLQATSRFNQTTEQLERNLREGQNDIILAVFLKKLEQSLKNVISKQKNLGEQFDVIQENIFKNDYLERIQKKFKNQGINIDLQLTTTQQRQKELNSVDNYFQNIMKSQNFYEQIQKNIPKIQIEYEKLKMAIQKCEKNPNPLEWQQLKEKEQLFNIQKIMLKYYEHLRQNKELALPIFAQSPILTQNTLYLSEINITKVQAEALRIYLFESQNIEKIWVKSLIIDDCGVKDNVFEVILDGMYEQGQLQKLVYSSNELGDLSVRKLEIVLPNLVDLQLINLTGGISKENLRFLLTCIKNSKNKSLMKLKLSGINLNDDPSVAIICEILSENNGNLIDIDFSWGCLKPQQLFKIMDSLCQQLHEPLGIRCLNLSYNSLYFGKSFEGKDTKQPLIESSNMFLESLIEFTKEQADLKHADFSGMNFGKAQVKRLVEQGIVLSKSLIAVHLSDNEIQIDDEFKQEILDIFGTKSEDLSSHCALKLHVNNKIILNPQRMKKICQIYSQIIDTNSVLNNENVDSVKYKNHLFRSKQSKALGISKGMNSTKISNGIGRFQDNQIDKFVITRRLNHPELIFNQHFYLDRYFAVDSDLNWKLSEGNDCHYCDRHQLITIFYSIGTKKEENKDLIEITDPELKKEVFMSLNLNIKDNRKIAPYILGTVVNGGFKRKLRMLKAEYLALLSVIHSDSYINLNQLKDVMSIKKGIIKITEKTQQINVDHITEKLKGWNKPLYQMLRQNYLTDSIVVNEPYDLENNEPEHTNFCYSAFVPPGHHQFLIYCPVTNRVFCKDLVVGLNHFEIYPEYPRTPIVVKKKPKQDAWRMWVEASNEKIEQCYLNDRLSGDYIPKNFLKKVNDQEMEEINQQLLKNYRYIITFQQELLIDSLKYPRIDFETLSRRILEAQEKNQDKLGSAFLEVAYISTNRDQNKLKASINRAELLEYILRCINESYKNFTDQGTLASYIDQGMRNFVLPISEKSPIEQMRKVIHKNKMVNDLLIENKDVLVQIYNEFRKKNHGLYQFNFDQARYLFDLNQTSLCPMVSSEVIKRCFVSAKMTIDNELQNSYQYCNLTYVEFLDFLCRISINHYSGQTDQQWVDSSCREDHDQQYHKTENITVKHCMSKLKELKGQKLYDWTKKTIMNLIEKRNETIKDGKPPLEFKDIDEDSDYDELLK